VFEHGTRFGEVHEAVVDARVLDLVTEPAGEDLVHEAGVSLIGPLIGSDPAAD
jgi:hypothetical protein